MSCDSLHSYFLSTLFIVLGALRLTTTFIAALGLRDRDIHVELRPRHPCRASTPLVCAPAVGQAKGNPWLRDQRHLARFPRGGSRCVGSAFWVTAVDPLSHHERMPFRSACCSEAN